MKCTLLKYWILIFLITRVSFAQDEAPGDKNKILTQEKNWNSELKDEALTGNNLIDINKENFEKEGIEKFEINFFKEKKKSENSADVLSSVGSNISFGGFWDRYAVINFTPQMNIKPVSFINIYANHNLNCLIPLSEIKEYSQSIILQGLAVLAVDNSFKMIFNSKSWITDVISFTAKNVLINFLIKPFIKKSINSPAPILQYENYYYSMSISF